MFDSNDPRIKELLESLSEEDQKTLKWLMEGNPEDMARLQIRLTQAAGGQSPNVIIGSLLDLVSMVAASVMSQEAFVALLRGMAFAIEGKEGQTKMPAINAPGSFDLN